MYRNAEKDLLEWRNQPGFKPLLLRGARQVGKSYLAESFGQAHFDSCVTVNFEFNTRFKSCFSTLDPRKIINLIENMTNESIIPGKTLLFLDEIQECPEAILSLRYFKEKMPDLHIIGAGSLLEFTLKKPEFRLPVGRVQSYYLYPLSFSEFLIALGHEKLSEYLSVVDLKSGIDEAMHQLLLEKLQEYCIIGGLPEVVLHYVAEKNLKQCEIAHASLSEYYRRDFGKYANRINLKYLETLYDKIPRIIGQKFKYAHVIPDVLSREIKPALNALIDAGLVNSVYHTSASGLPLQATINERIFKLFFVDIGLVSYMSGLSMHTLINEHLISLNRGALAEQYVNQELLANSKPYEKSQLYYWQREKPGSTADVDFVMSYGTQILPIEVKAGRTGRLKSLQLFLDEKGLDIGLRVSQNQLSLENRVLSIPLYLVHQIPRLVDAL